MNLNSKYFDRIRIRPDAAEEQKKEAERVCEWQGCERPASHRAPKGRYREGEYHNFCIDHVRTYNKSYNYFSGMADEDVAAYQKSASTGHRPTWSMGAKEGEAPAGFNFAQAFADPFGFMGGEAEAPKRPQEKRRPLRNLERKSFTTLDLDGQESAEEIRARYKALVKELHPDANGGDRTYEDRLREIIHAYHYLRSAGFC